MEKERINNIPPLAMSKWEFDELVETVFNEKLGGLDATNPPPRTPKELRANLRPSEQWTGEFF